MKTIIYIFLAALLLITGSCTLQKRNYQKGYYVNWLHKKTGHTTAKISNDERNNDVAKKTVSNHENSEPLIVSQNSSNDKPIFSDTKKAFIPLKDTCGDRILYKNGEEVLAKVIEITDNQIKYKRCDNLSGPLFVVTKQKIELIIYNNGVKETITNNIEAPINTPSQPQPAYQNKTTSPYAITAVVLAAAGIFIIPFIGSIISLIFASMAEMEIKSNPTKYEGLELVKVARIIDWVIISLFILLVIFFIVLLSMI